MRQAGKGRRENGCGKRGKGEVIIDTAGGEKEKGLWTRQAGKRRRDNGCGKRGKGEGMMDAASG
jgi:hypothetical protein